MAFIMFIPDLYLLTGGPDPVFHQIRNKEKNAGVTIHKVDDDFDTGPVVINEMIRLDPADTHGTLNERLSYTPLN